MIQSNRIRNLAIASSLAMAMGAASAFAQLPTAPIPVTSGADANLISTNITLTADKIWILKGFTMVTNGATLTIDPGTTIQGDSTVRGTLLVDRGARIDAAGTAAAPITFRGPTADRGMWGGLVLLGRATANPGPYNQYEALPWAIYGGNGSHENDNSGTLTYVRLDGPGFPVAVDRELNGITLCAVGSGTVIHHVQVHRGDDDGFEWFGGSVNTSHLVVTNTVDDSYDTDFGYSGNSQYMIAIQSVEPPRQRGGTSATPIETVGDRGVECGSNGDPSNEPVTKPTWKNLTFIDNGRSGGPFEAKQGCGGFYEKMVLVGGGGDTSRSDWMMNFDGKETIVGISDPNSSYLDFKKTYLTGKWKNAFNFIANPAGSPNGGATQGEIDNAIAVVNATIKQRPRSSIGGYGLYQNLKPSLPEIAADSAGAIVGNDLWYQGWTLTNTVKFDSGDVEIVADVTPPANVTSLAATSLTATSVQLTWAASASADAESVFVVYRNDGSYPTGKANGTVIPLASTVTTFTVTGLTEKTGYSFGLFVSDSSDNVSAVATSAQVRAKTLDITAPANVTALTATALSASSIRLNWAASASADAESVLVVYRNDHTYPTGIANGTVAARLASSVTEYNVTGLAEKSGYSFGLFVKDTSANASAGVAAAQVHKATLDQTAPANATALVATAITADSVRLTWTPSVTADAESVFVVYTSGTTYPTGISNGTVAGRMANTATTLAVAGLIEQTTYSFGLFVRDSSGNVSAVATGAQAQSTTLDQTGPAAITGLSATPVSISKIALAWTSSVTADVDSLFVRYVAGATPPANPTSGLLAHALGKGAVVDTISGLDEKTEYAFAIFARDSAGNFAPFATVASGKATTLDQTKPVAITALAATALSTTRIALAWTASVSTDVDSLFVRYALGSTPPADYNSGTLAHVLGKTAVLDTISGLTLGTEYSFAVFARDAAGNFSNYATSAAISATTLLVTPVASSNWRKAQLVRVQGNDIVFNYAKPTRVQLTVTDMRGNRVLSQSMFIEAGIQLVSVGDVKGLHIVNVREGKNSRSYRAIFGNRK